MGKQSCPYASIYLSCLKIGFTPRDLHTMPLGRAIYLIDAYNEMHDYSTTKSNQAKEATQEDIQRFFA